MLASRDLCNSWPAVRKMIDMVAENKRRDLHAERGRLVKMYVRCVFTAADQ